MNKYSGRQIGPDDFFRACGSQQVCGYFCKLVPSVNGVDAGNVFDNGDGAMLVFEKRVQ
ncbi:hypothetical protein D3C73_1558580 [compost metagenome]